MVPKISAQLFSQSLLTGTFAIISIGNAIASEIPTVQVSAVDRQSELLADSTDDSIAKIGGIYPLNTLLNPESAPATSNLALARRKKRINTKPQIKRGGINTQPQIQNTPVNTSPQIQNTPINTPPQVQNTPINTQPQVQNPPINTPPPMPSGFSATQNQIQYKRNDFGFAAQFGNGTSFGFQGKVGVMDNISIRPEFFFGNGGGEVENKQFSAFISIPPSVILPAVAPNPDLYTFNTPILLTGDYTVFAAFTPSTAIGNNPAGTSIPAGTVIPAGTTIPGGTTIPIDPTTTTNISGDNIAGIFKTKTTQNTSLGLAITYDFKLDPTGKSTAYFGPKIAFNAGSGSENVPTGAAPITLNTNETKIGLIAGLDYVLFDGFTIGANATYNLSRSLSGTFSSGAVNFPLQSVGGGSSTDFGIRIGYQF